jgi:predicted ribosome quality control (RQC) complex YloA/Tae2 family protein
MAMVRAIMFHATLLGNSCAAVQRSQSSLSPSILSFVGTRPVTRWTARDHSHRIFGAFTSRGNFRKRAQRLSSRLAESPTDNLDRKTEDPEFYQENAEDFIYDNDADASDAAMENEEDINSLDESENVPSRSNLLHKALLQAVKTSLNNLSKKTKSLQRELEKAQSLEETMSRANLIVSNLYRLPPGTTSIEVEDWENDGKIVELVLNTNEYASAQEESDALFALARKMKRGSKVVEELLNNSLEGEEILKDALVSLHSSENINQDSHDDIIEGRQLDEDGLIFIQEKLERTSNKTGFKTPNLNALLSQNNHRRQPQNAEKSQRTTRYTPNPRELISPSGHKGESHSLFFYLRAILSSSNCTKP